jgi:hypothetical protein
VPVGKLKGINMKKITSPAPKCHGSTLLSGIYEYIKYGSGFSISYFSKVICKNV